MTGAHLVTGTHLMAGTHCACGFSELADETLADHLGAVFIPRDDVAPDGSRHAEAAAVAGAAPLAFSTAGVTPATPARACLCGFTGTAAGLDAHLLGAFAPPGRLGRDGFEHRAVPGAR